MTLRTCVDHRAERLGEFGRITFLAWRTFLELPLFRGQLTSLFSRLNKLNEWERERETEQTSPKGLQGFFLLDLFLFATKPSCLIAFEGSRKLISRWNGNSGFNFNIADVSMERLPWSETEIFVKIVVKLFLQLIRHYSSFSNLHEMMECLGPSKELQGIVKKCWNLNLCLSMKHS